MAESSTRRNSTGHPHTHPHRPRMPRIHHTWHGELATRSHFEDFMREIGVDAQLTHLCCVPRQAEYVRSRTKSQPVIPASLLREEFFTTPRIVEAGELASHEHIRRRHISSPATLTESPHPITRTLVTTHVSTHANRKPSHAPPIPAKTFPHTSVYTKNHGAAHICTLVSADQTLRQAARTSVVGLVSTESLEAGSPEDQAHWTPLPQQPALSRMKHSSPPDVPSRERTVSRVPSFASLDTVSSSEGPETPRGHYSPLPSPSHTRSPSDSLSYLEHTSRLRVPGVCVTCKRQGANFPSCSLCGDMWCSRECRVQATRGHKHTCARRTMQASVAVDAGPHGRFEE